MADIRKNPTVVLFSGRTPHIIPTVQEIFFTHIDADGWERGYYYWNNDPQGRMISVKQYAPNTWRVLPENWKH